MPKLENEGMFNVEIVDALVGEPRTRKGERFEDEKAFALILKLETEDGLTTNFQLDWTDRIIPLGMHKGKKEKEAAMEKLAEIGIEDGYPGNLKKMLEAGEKIPCQVKMEYSEFVGKDGLAKRTLYAKYLNPARKEINIKDVDFSKLIPEYSADDGKPEKTEIESETDNIPF